MLRIAPAWPSAAMPILSWLSLISRNSPKRLGMVSPELSRLRSEIEAVRHVLLKTEKRP